MVHDIRNAFNELLEENDWMDEATKAVAREKVVSLSVSLIVYLSVCLSV